MNLGLGGMTGKGCRADGVFLEGCMTPIETQITGVGNLSHCSMAEMKVQIEQEGNGVAPEARSSLTRILRYRFFWRIEREEP
ncbi:MAG: hypothetical protein DRP71_06245 [Verrucomicrobia bacterium]|nr:MAG: hypothetical protein DRP71_06245 [Verrucomicrobiota bacterium]